MMQRIDPKDYTYELPDERIARYPLATRDGSKLLVSAEGVIEHHQFHELPDLLPAHATLIFNNTRVIPARLLFTKETGASIEIFLLDPVAPSPVIAETMSAQGACEWRCAIGNLKRWSEGMVLYKEVGSLLLEARLTDRENGIVSFRWSGENSFAEVVSGVGKTPLPPYLNREAEASDKERYQTVYSRFDGAVAAPTAGLHFTPNVLDKLRAKGITTDYLTLHVSAGTFLPIKAEDARDHVMHREQISITVQNLRVLLNSDFIVPVGTTSMRTLESIYWYGVMLQENPDSQFDINQRYAYQMHRELPSRKEAVERVLHALEKRKTDVLSGSTSIYIMPGYTFRMCDGLVTNFHQPGSTLILLVAAFVGEHWKTIYESALANGYRFLSYGDSSLLLPSPTQPSVS